MDQLIEAVQHQRLEHDVGGEKPEAERQRDPDPLAPCSARAQKAPCTRGKLDSDARKEKWESRRPVPRTGEGIGSSLHQQPRSDQRQHNAEA